MNYLSLITTLVLIIFIIWIVKYLEKKLPERDKRIKDKYAKELKETIQKEKLEIQKNINKNKIENIKEYEKKIKADKKKLPDENEQPINLYNTIQKKKNALNKKQLYKENIKNGKRYEAYVAEYFRKLNYTVWEHGKEKGFKDENIDLFVMNKEEAFFIQCKYYRKSKIDHNVVKATRTDIRTYMQNNIEFTKLIKERKKKILYVIPRECLTPGAWTYIKENSEIMEYKVIPMEI